MDSEILKGIGESIKKSQIAITKRDVKIRSTTGFFFLFK